ncbi:unnamed protein product [Gemmata massiliana]|uniref:Uncharacterized protein n=1 Tax=Gemmata massiliana TaxID=1210884 RepID=A0A6P2CSZ0_9BACT|nr:unnamed protein product [Gemmata massiliana]
MVQLPAAVSPYLVPKGKETTGFPGGTASNGAAHASASRGRASVRSSRGWVGPGPSSPLLVATRGATAPLPRFGTVAPLTEVSVARNLPSLPEWCCVTPFLPAL